MRAKHVKETILMQILELDKWALPAYGARNFEVIKRSKHYSGGVRFTVNGLKFKGNVEIRLAHSDTYTIDFVKDDVLEKRYTNVYAFDLIKFLDYVEGK